MANVLTRMAQNALGHAPVVEPVVRPLFAAPRASEQPPPAHITSAEPHNPSRMRAEQDVSIPPSRTPELYRNHPPESEPRRGSRATEPPVPPIKADAAPLPEPAPRPTLRQAIDRIFAPRKSDAPPRIPLAPPAPAMGMREAAPRGPEEGSATRNADENPSHRPTAPMEPQPRPTIAQAQPENHGSWLTQHSGRQPSRVQAQAAPPELHVTIGSIELKAPAQAVAASPARTARRPAHMSLNEYLERRRSGRL
jgi:hypothetical protein